MARPLALVTGPSSGIGEELARVLAREGWDLVLVARSAEQAAGARRRAEAAHGASSLVIPADLRDPAAPAAVWKALGERPLDALVNNAGYGVGGAIAETPLDAELGMFQVNVMALVHLVKLALPGMVARRSGRDPERGEHGRLPAGPLPGRLLRQQGLRAELHRGARRGAARQRRQRDAACAPGRPGRTSSAAPTSRAHLHEGVRDDVGARGRRDRLPRHDGRASRS